MRYKRHSVEFKGRALAEVEKTGMVTETARRFGIARSTLQKWMRKKKQATEESYSEAFQKCVAKYALATGKNNYQCGLLFQVPANRVKEWKEKYGEQCKEETKKVEHVEKERRFIHVTSHSGYYK